MFRYKEKITQKDVMKFANEILKNKAPISQLELDDRWATHYGDFKVCLFRICMIFFHDVSVVLTLFSAVRIEPFSICSEYVK